MKKEKIILGIDPGTSIMGYGLISVTGNKMTLITLGEIKLAKYDNHPLINRLIPRLVLRLPGLHNNHALILFNSLFISYVDFTICLFDLDYD